MSRLTRKVEEALLGAALFNPAALPSMRRWLPSAVFSRADHQALWQVLHAIDFTTVPSSQIPATVSAAIAEQIAEPGLRACLSPARLAQLANACPTPGSAPLYGGMVLEAAVHRSVERAGEELRQTAREAEVDQAAQALARVEGTGQRLAALGAAWQAAPETVRNLLDTAPEQPVTLAPRTERSRVDLRAEAETVASLLYQPAQLDEVRWLQRGDFADPQLAAVYQAMATLHERHAPIDPLTVAWQAQRQSGAQPSEQVLDELDRGGTPGTAVHTGEQVLATAALDRLDGAGHQLRNLARHPALAPASLVGHSDHALQPVAADRERIRQAERELAPADQEPAPAEPATQPATAAPEMEMDL
ncbi:DnaB-like helicase N-terminal domain-containing protein [Streptantibioticus rubrisoli]|uniref:DNA helicase n=1 Tax=Streptantibioticus rubrisoli TaxID=1387313 RepID=A0ABT1PKD1_9ACTN|nr:DnaB-like helicase N-terminal domain-containing protein [Streptantibioticus rubrisoli]MCQ4045822.1 DNA helicase [Streptantibioticus rubrisoli]